MSLEQRISFVAELDKLKHVFRQTYLMDGSRRENDAEHAWHLAVMACILAGDAATPNLNLGRAVKMVLFHDVVEIDAGDTYCYDTQGNLGRVEREREAADRIYGMLPTDQAEEFKALWEEFEARETPEAKFAAALDRFQPLLHNYHTEGRAWREHGIHAGQVLERNKHIAEGSPALWAYAESMIQDAVAKGWLAPTPAIAIANE